MPGRIRNLIRSTLFAGVGNKLSLEDLRGTRIPGVRKFIKYGIQKEIVRSRCWLFISLIFVALTVYHAQHYAVMYATQRTEIVRSYKFAEALLFPIIIMCTPTSYSFRRMLNNQYLIEKTLTILNSTSLYIQLASLVNISMSSVTLFDQLKLHLNRLVVDCRFQTRPCNMSHIHLHKNAEHACFVINSTKSFSSNVTGRDGGFDILLNLNAFDGMDERPGLSGGLKIVFMDSKHMQLPHPHDVAYVESGLLNSVSLVTHRRSSITNCSTTKYIHDTNIKMDRRQLRYYGTELGWPCIVQNYYTTKTSAKLRSEVVYQKLSSDFRRTLQLNASRANELKSIYVSHVRDRDFRLASEASRLNKELIGTFARWTEPRCTDTKHIMNIKVKLPYIRGKSHDILAYTERHLRLFAETNIYSKKIIRTRAKILFRQSSNLITLNYTKGSSFFETLIGTSVEWERFLVSNDAIQQRCANILHILGNANIFEHSNIKLLEEFSPIYLQAHNSFRREMTGLKNCFLSDEKYTQHDAAFVHNGPLICGNYKNTSSDYDTCPDEFLCPDFPYSYTDKYGMPFAQMRDSTKPPVEDVPLSIFMHCSLGPMTKNLVRGYNIDVNETYAAWFELYTLNRIATLKWPNDKLFDRRDFECRRFQACWRLTYYASMDNQGTHNYQGTFNYEDAADRIMKRTGILAYSSTQSCERQSDTVRVSLSNYVQVYDRFVVQPFEQFYKSLMDYRNNLHAVRMFKTLEFAYTNIHSSLIKQFDKHLIGYLKTSNMSELAHFLNRRGRIMIGRVRMYAQEVKQFVTFGSKWFSEMFRTSRILRYRIQSEPNLHLRALRQNVTRSVLSSNISHALYVIKHTEDCSKLIFQSLVTNGKATLVGLDNWISNIQTIQTRANQYVKDETLDEEFVRRNFVQLEMQLPHPHDVAYVESGLLNSVSLVTHRRSSITNCSTTKYIHDTNIKMDRRQLRYYGTELGWPCIVQNYYTTKTSAKLRSEVVYQKLSSDFRRTLQLNASRANELKSIYVSHVRDRDFRLASEASRLNKELIGTFARWTEPRCTDTKHIMNIKVKLPYIRGKSHDILAYTERHLRLFAETNIYSKKIIRTRAKILFRQSSNLITLNYTKGSSFFETLIGTSVEWERFLVSNDAIQQRCANILHILGNANIFEHSNIKLLEEFSPIYLQAHNSFRREMTGLKNCFLSDEKYTQHDAAFVHNGPLICGNYKNTSSDYDTCPDEFLCPDFPYSYTDKYGMPFAQMRDSTKPPVEDVPLSIFMHCSLGPMTKNLVRGYNIDVNETYAAWFELYTLNRIATLKWPNDKLFDRRDFECRRFQACWRLTYYASMDNQGTHNYQGTFNYEDAADRIMKRTGILAYSSTQSCERQSDTVRVSLSNYVQVYDRFVVQPFEQFYKSLMDYRNNLHAVRMFKTLEFAYTNIHSSLIKQFDKHLIGYLKTSNMSELAHFLNRRGRIMIGRVRMYAQEVKQFVTFGSKWFSEMFRTSRILRYRIQSEPNLHLRALRQNVTRSVLSSNISHALYVIKHTEDCSKLIFQSLVTNGKATLVGLDNWISNIQTIQTRANQYVKDETLDEEFVRRNFVQLEIYYEDLMVGLDVEQYPMTRSALISRFGAIGRFYMGLKIFNVAEFMGPIILFVIFAVFRYVFGD